MTPEFLPWTTRWMAALVIEIGNAGEGEILEGEIIYLIFDFLNMRCLFGIQGDML